jgi:hypothetical protein
MMKPGWVIDLHGADLSEVFQLVQGQIVTRQMQHGIQQRTRVPIRQDETIAIGLQIHRNVATIVSVVR